MKIDHVLAMVVACFATLMATLFLVDTQSVFDPPYLLPLLNTLFLAIIPCFVAYTAARLFLSFGSIPILVLGSGMLALGLGGAVSGWFIGSQAGPNATITIYNCGACLCALLNVCSAVLHSLLPQWNPWKRPGIALLVCYLAVTTILGGIVTAAVAGVSPPFIVQGVGPTPVGRAVLACAIILFMASSALIFSNRAISGLSLFRCYAAGLVLMGIGLIGVLLQHYVGSPLGWAGRCAQYAGGLFILTGVVGLWLKRFKTGQSIDATAEELVRERVRELEALASRKEGLIRQNEERLQLALDAAHLATWDWDILTDAVVWNSEHYRMLGYEPDSFAPTYRHWADRLHPEDLPATEARIRTSMAAGNDYRAEFRVILPDGTERILEALGRFDRDDAGRPVRCYGAMRDVTEWHLMVADLRQINETLEQRVAERTAELVGVNGRLLLEIEERKQAEMEREQFYKFFLTSVDIMVIADPSGSFLKINPAGLELLGYSEAELASRPFIDFVHPDDRQSTRDELARQQLTGSTSAFVNRYLCKDGSLCWLSWRAVYNRDENRTFAIGRDIGDRIKQEQALQKSEEEFRLLAEAMPQIVWITRADGWNIYFNRQWMDYTGLTLEESLGHGWNKPFHPDDRQVAWDAWQNATTNLATYSLECRLRRADGVYRWWLVRGVPVFDEQGAVLKWFGTCTDIDEFKKAEEERLSLERQLLHAQKLESLGVLAGGIAHDFNNILMAIIGNADLALMKLNAESPVITNLHQIEQSAARAADLARQMLAYSGKGKFLIEKLDLNRLLEEMLHMLEVSISKKVVLRLNLAPNLPAVEADATQLRQVIMNLVINASEAIGDESGVIAIATGSMVWDGRSVDEFILNDNVAAGMYVYLEVSDSGCGMDKETLERIFDPFFTTKFTGRGLGMAAVHGIVRGHKGAIKVYTEPGKGATVRALLPAAGGPIETRNIAADRDNWQGSGTVLLVDDEEMVRNIGTELLNSIGYSVVTAGDGIEALAMFRSRPDICCVILDLTMPRMDGEQCFRELRQIDPDVKVMISSGYSEHEVVQKFAGTGLAGFIQKPYALSGLKAVMQGIMERSG